MSSESDPLFNICDTLVTAVETDTVAEKKKKKVKRYGHDKKKHKGMPDAEDYGEKPPWLAGVGED